MDKAQLRSALKAKFPGIQFEYADALGTKRPVWQLCIVIPKKVLMERSPMTTEVEQFVESCGLKAVWPTCAEIYADYRVVSF